MSFEKFLDREMANDNFNHEQYSKSSKERQNISKIGLDADSGCAYLKIGEFYTGRYDELSGIRYVACLEVTYDTVLAVYDSNSRLCVVYRHTRLTPPVHAQIEKVLRGAKIPNFEARLIGMQNGQSQYLLNDVMALLKKFRIPLFEVDLFGTSTRNIAFDMKTGLSYDVLVENRPYKPGELLNKMTMEQFEREAYAPPPTTPLTKKQKPSKKL